MAKSRAGRGRSGVLAPALALLAIAGPASTDLPPSFAPPAAPLSAVLEWRRGTYGYARFLRVADLARDGRNEILGVSSARWWTASGRAGGHEQTWVSAPYPGGISSIEVANVDGDLAREVLVANASTVRLYDGVTKVLQDEIAVPAGNIRHLQVADVDRDGHRDVVFCAGGPAPTAVYVYDLATGGQHYVLDTAVPRDLPAGCAGLAVGNIDDDEAREIVVANGAQAGYVVDGVTQSIEWQSPSGFGWIVRLGDVDGDGRAEIVSASSDVIRIFDGRRQTLRATIAAPVAVMEVADVNRDGFADVMFTSDFAPVQVALGPDLTERRSVVVEDHFKQAIAAGDLDGDGWMEMIVGSAYSETGHLYVTDPMQSSVRWKSRGEAGPFYGIAHGDVDGNGWPDLVHTAVSGDGPGALLRAQYFVYGAERWRFRRSGPPEPADFDHPMIRLVNLNADDDPQEEIVTGTGETYSFGRVRCLDGRTGALQWETSLGSYLGVSSLGAGDVDGDGQVEIVVGTSGAPYYFADIAVVYVLDGASGAVEWQSPALDGPSGVTHLRLAQLDADPPMEIVAVRADAGDVFVVDAVARDLRSLGRAVATALDTIDRDGDGRAEIVVGTAHGDLRVLDPVSGAVTENLGRHGYGIVALRAGDYNRDGMADYAFAAGDRVQILDGRSRTFLWTSGSLGGAGSVGRRDSLLVADVDRDGWQELVVNTGTSLDVFELRPAGARPPRVRRRG